VEAAPDCATFADMTVDRQRRRLGGGLLAAPVIATAARSSRWVDEDSAQWTRRLIAAALANGGRYDLPYRLHATKEQFARAYPEAERFAALKQKMDPHFRFRNRLWKRYLPR
jgi:FAD/FMN-containing dehydrogenase